MLRGLYGSRAVLISAVSSFHGAQYQNDNPAYERDKAQKHKPACFVRVMQAPDACRDTGDYCGKVEKEGRNPSEYSQKRYCCQYTENKAYNNDGKHEHPKLFAACASFDNSVLNYYGKKVFQ
jgi:hypothetical protein